MKSELNRRECVGVTTTAAIAGSLATTVAHAAEGNNKFVKILGIACSPRCSASG